MRYFSTRDNKISFSSSQAIVKGISEEGGLFVPESIPKFTRTQLEEMINCSYAERAYTTLSQFLTDFSRQELTACISNAYGFGKFDTNSVAELANLFPSLYFLELWHGPTCAFKDMALQLLPHLLTTAARKNNINEKFVILVATSGDTGKAALEGFKDVEGTQVLVFYPRDGVSPMQKLQMQTQEGNNVGVCAIEGNFDDAQSAVKRIFTDSKLKSQLAEHNMVFSSANSINWGRLVPQIAYYVSAYCDLVKNEEIVFGEKINIVVPSGNFGNILAAYYAKNMGVPINKLICASNKNNVLTDFFRTGSYNRNRAFLPSISPSMDILISSNLERLLHHISEQNHLNQDIAKLMASLKETGEYKVSDKLKAAIDKDFFASCCSDDETKEVISNVFDEYSYLCDTHTAVAVKAYNDYVSETNDDTKTVIASTANPYKFSSSVLSALGADWDGDDFGALAKLEEITSTKAPEQLKNLKHKQIRFNNQVKDDEIELYVKRTLKI